MAEEINPIWDDSLDRRRVRRLILGPTVAARSLASPRPMVPISCAAAVPCAGNTLTRAGRTLEGHCAVKLRSDVDVAHENGTLGGGLLLLQGRPLREPVAQAGPLVMNTRAEVEQAFADYQRTRFGGWPWPKDGPVHGDVPERFAKKPGSDIER